MSVLSVCPESAACSGVELRSVKVPWFLTAIGFLSLVLLFGGNEAKAAPTVNIESRTVTEAAGPRSYSTRLMLSEPSTETCTVTVTPVDGSAIRSQDYFALTTREQPLTIDFAPGDTEKEFMFGIIGDGQPELTESFELLLSDAINCNAGAGARITILDVDVEPYGPVLNFSSTYVNESDRTARLTWTLSEPVTETCSFRIDPTPINATSETDYIGGGGLVSMPPGRVQYDYVFQIIDDDLVEPNESIVFKTSGLSACARAGSPGVITIVDDDGPDVDPTVSVGSVTVREGETSTALVDVYLSKSPVSPVTVTVTSVSDTATPGSDYRDESQTITFAPESATTQQVAFPILNDQAAESVETFSVAVIETDSAIIGESGEVVIVDDDDPALSPVIHFDGYDVIVFESMSFARVPVLLDRRSASDCAATVVTGLFKYNFGGDAEADVDYTSVSTTVVIPAGQTAAYVDVPILQDAEIERYEFFNMRLSDVVGDCRQGSELGVVSVKILDDDGDVSRPTPPFVIVSNATVTEGDDREAEVTVSIPIPSETAQEFQIRTRQFTAVDGEDYRGRSVNVQFEAGETSKTLTFPILDSNDIEPVQYFRVLPPGKTGDEFFNNDDSGGVVTIRDDDYRNDGDSPRPVVSVGSATVTEGADSEATVEVTLSQVSDQAVTATVEVQDGTAVAGEDFVAAAREVTFAPNELTKQVSWSILNDDRAEDTESFLTRVTSADNADAGSGGEITIVDDDGGDGTLRVDIGDVVVTEGDEVRAEVSVTLSEASSTTVTVEVASRQRTAISGPDYFGRNYEVAFAPGETQKTVGWLIVDDTEVEPMETFAIVIFRVDGATEGRSGTVTIIDNDGDGGVSRLDIGDATVTEGSDAQANVLLTLSQPATDTVTVEVASRQRTAISGPDYLGRNFVVAFEPGEVEKIVSWAIVDDSESESTETFAVVPVSINGAQEGHTGIVTINDDDGGSGELKVNIGDTTVTEGTDSEATVSVTLSRASTAAVTVEVASRQRSAVSGPDYLGRNFVVTYAPGETEKSVSWIIVDDDDAETVETFSVVAVSIDGADEGRAGTVTINDDDDGSGGQRPRLDIGDATVTEGSDAVATVNLTLATASTESVTVEVASRQRTAISGPDYLGRNHVVSFSPGETTKTVSWNIVDDDLTELEEVFAVVQILEAGERAGRSGTVTIRDDDG